MVQQYYTQQVTQLSRQELEAVFKAVKPPAALLGGWAVHLHVNDGFNSEHGRNYIGSRDIDVGLHVDPAADPSELRDGPLGTSLQAIQELGYTQSRFGFVQHFHRETGDRLSEAEAAELPMYDVFEVYVDTIPDTADLDGFDSAFGFRPPAEPLLQPVFEAGQGAPLADVVEWSVPDTVSIVPPDLLAAMKVRSLPDREEGHKRAKDVADLHALLWYVTEYSEIRDDVHGRVAEEDLTKLETVVDDQLVQSAATLLQIDTALIRNTIERLFQ
jgi:hypothetical protein